MFAIGSVSLIVHVPDAEAAQSRAAACRPTYDVDGDVLLVGRDPFSGDVAVCYVPTTAPRVTFTVNATEFHMRALRAR